MEAQEQFIYGQTENLVPQKIELRQAAYLQGFDAWDDVTHLL